MVRLDEIGLQTWMPCRPDHFEREVRLGGRQWPARLHSCEADGGQFGLMEWQAGTTAQASALAAELLAASGRNLGGSLPQAVVGWKPTAMSLEAGSGRWQLRGAGADGRPRLMDTAVLVRGSRVLQVTVVGETLRPAQVEPFFDNLAVWP